jgi:hypothetical protein
MKVLFKGSDLILTLGGLEADVLFNALKFAAYDAGMDRHEYILRFGVDQVEVKEIYDQLRNHWRESASRCRCLQ